MRHLLEVPDRGRPVNCGLHERSRDHVHHQDQDKRNEHGEEETQPWRNLAYQRLQHITPVSAPCQPLEEGEDCAGQAGEPRLEVFELLVFIHHPYLRHNLNQVDGHQIDHHHQQAQCPYKGLGRVHETAHQHLQVACEPHYVQNTDRTDRAEYSNDAKQVARSKYPSGAGHECQKQLDQLRADEGEVKQVPAPAIHAEELLSIRVEAEAELHSEGSAEAHVYNPQKQRRLVIVYVPGHVVRLDADVSCAQHNEDTAHSLKPRVLDELLSEPARPRRSVHDVPSVRRRRHQAQCSLCQRLLLDRLRLLLQSPTR
mmetsp:Transcript_63077/g.162398  ORF Transcript_63077/g.162398 Transcript_63077/m.162398 type:complete len:313 (+) Transcript_63077:418-1356(+)